MKIGIIIGCLSFGGAERVATNLAKWLSNRGHEVSFFLTKKATEKEYALPKTIKRFECYDKYKLVLIKKLRFLLHQNKPDVVLIMSTPICVYGIPALLGLGIPIVVSERSAPQNAIVKSTTRKLSYILMKYADSYVFQTNGAMQCFPESIRRKGAIIPNPIVLDEIPKPYQGKRKKRVVAVGRLIPEKNYPMLIKAFKSFSFRFPDYILDIYGDGKERENLEKMVNDLELNDKVNLNHSCSNVLEIIKDAEIYVLSSDLEGMPNALIEAMALGLTCIATDCPAGGPSELIIDGFNGFLVPVNDDSVLSDKLCIVAEDSNLRNTVCNNAIKIRERLNIDIVGEHWLSLLKKTAFG